MSQDSPVVSYIDPSLKFSYSENYKLSIRFLPGGFSFCILNNDNNKFLALESYVFENQSKRSHYVTSQYLHWLNKILKNQLLLSSRFLDVAIIIGESPYTVLPPALFADSASEDYLRFNHPVADYNKIISDKSDTPEMVVVYAIPILLSDWISASYPAAKRSHLVTPLIRSFYTRFKGDKTNVRAFLNVRPGSFELVIFKKSQLFYCNTFSVADPTDLLYYLLFVFEQLQLDADELILGLVGEIDNRDDLFELLAKYVRNIDFVPVHDHFSYSHEMQTASLHKFYDLLNATL